MAFRLTMEMPCTAWCIRYVLQPVAGALKNCAMCCHCHQADASTILCLFGARMTSHSRAANLLMPHGLSVHVTQIRSQCVTGGLRTCLSTAVPTALGCHPVRSMAIRPDRLPVRATVTPAQVVTAPGAALPNFGSCRCRIAAKTILKEN
jgi:hypothetical protein